MAEPPGRRGDGARPALAFSYRDRLDRDRTALRRAPFHVEGMAPSRSDELGYFPESTRSASRLPDPPPAGRRDPRDPSGGNESLAAAHLFRRDFFPRSF